jgi:2-dehydro-3-deoxyphosphooctonate aldolase (KDO 8-P synthase)
MTVLEVLSPNPTVAAGAVRFGNRLPLALIAGPCVLESRGHALDTAGALKEIAARLGIGLVYKTSFDKANRTSASSPRGVGLDGALAAFEEIRVKLDLPVLTDVHESSQCAEVARVVDVLQIPAFLCRQTDLLVAAARTSRRGNSSPPGTWPTWWPRSPAPGIRTSWLRSAAPRSATTPWFRIFALFRSLRA